LKEQNPWSPSGNGSTSQDQNFFKAKKKRPRDRVLTLRVQVKELQAPKTDLKTQNRDVHCHRVCPPVWKKRKRNPWGEGNDKQRSTGAYASSKKTAVTDASPRQEK